MVKTRVLLSSIAGACSLLLSGCVQEMQQLNQGLGAINTALAGGGTGNYGGALMPSMTPEQEAALNNAFVRTSDVRIAQAIAEAQPTITAITKRIACFPGNALDVPRILGPYMAPEYHGPYGAMSEVSYHPKSQCLTVNRVDGWRMPALNALEYRVVYVSDQSGHSVSKNYRLIKQPDGTWLVAYGT